ncbi:hypothetical protein [uncultured Treponema sp.]|uniref:hypothetical protein n=1 Tax=uncultured Treponema sp. TaxID=162155 RepID=UPI0025F50AF3|nr:hypothetical protein [uncultured Treponema sp.]
MINSLQFITSNFAFYDCALQIVENFNVWDFELSADDMKKIAALDIGHSEIVNHSDPAFVKMINGWKIHE